MVTGDDSIIAPMKKSTRLRFNDPTPDLELTTAGGERVRLSALWAKQPLLLLLTRHFGCPQCKVMLDEIVKLKPQLEQSGLTLAAITQGKSEEVATFCRQYAPGILCLADPQRQAYRLYRLERGGLLQTFLSPRVWVSNSRAKKKGYNVEPTPAGQDAMQMSGVFIIGTDGIIRLPYYYDNIADHPPAHLLLSGVLSTGWDTPFDAPLASDR